MNLKKLKKVTIAILPALILATLIFAANTYYDLDLGKVVIDQVTRIVQDLEVLTGKIFGKNSAALFLGAEDQNIWLIGTTTASAYLKRGANQYVICDASGNCLEGGTGSYIGGNGSQNYIAKFLSSSTLATSTIYELSGNVGIGTTTPSAKLTVEGDISLNGNFQIQGNRTISGDGTITINPTGNLYLQTTNSYLDDSGNLIFGTGKYVETEKLQFSGNIVISPNSASGNTQVQILNSDGSYVADLIVEGDIQVSGGKITLATGETIDAETSDQITINSDGVTILKSGGSEILRISSSGAKITGAATTTDTLYISSGGAQISGNVNINSGNILVSGTGTFQTSPLTVGQILLSDSGLSASRTFTFPDISDEIVTKNATQTLTQKTISTGSTWQGNIISTQYGGTGQNWSTVSIGSLPYFSAVGTMSTLPIGATSTILTSSGTLPQWQSLADLSILTGSGAENYIPRWTGSLTLATSTIYELSGNIGIGTTTPSYKLTVNGDIYVSATSTLGSATSTPVIFGGYVQSNIIPYSDATYTLGAQGYRWANLYAATTTIGDTIIIGSQTIEGTATTTLFTSGNSNQFVLGANGLVGINALPVSPYNLYVGGQCVTGDTKLRRRKKRGKGNKVEQEYEEVEIKDIQPGDEIQTLDEKTGKLIWAKVNALMDMGVKPIFKLTTATGKTIKTTGNHPYLVKELKGRKPKHSSPIEGAGWITAEQIKEGDYVAVPKPKAGIFIDDANMFYAQKKAGWRIDYKTLKQFLEELFEVKFMNYYLTIPDERDSAYLKTQKYLKELNLRYGEFLTIKSKPLKYIFDQEEKKYKKKGNIDGMIAVDLLTCLDELDAIIILSGDSDYADFIQPILKKKKKILFMGFEDNMAWKLRQKQHIYFEKIREIVDSKNKNAPSFENGVPLLLPLYANQKTLSSPLLLEKGKDFVWARVSSIEKTEEEKVYDIEVEGTHNFIGNDIFAHNTYISATTTIMGNVGIGTTTPTYTLDVNGNLRVTGTTTFGGLTYTWPTSYGSSGYVLVNNGSGTLSWEPTGGVSGGGSANQVAFWNGPTSISGDNNLWWDNTENKLGIGTSTPASTLHVVSSTTQQLIIGYDSAAYGWLSVDSSGVLHIGSTSGVIDFTGFKMKEHLLPAVDNLYDLGSPTLRWRDIYLGPGSVKMYSTYTDASNYELAQFSYDSNVVTLKSVAAGTGTVRPIQIKTGLNIGFYMDTSGNVGIGTTGPDAKLDVLATTDQLRLTYTDGSVYGSFNIDSAGDLTITPSGDEIIVPDDNLRVCSGGACPSPTYSGSGNLQVENIIEVLNKGTFIAVPQGTTGSYSWNLNSIEICQFGTCCPPWKDCDGDGRTYAAGTDCDEGCSTCYVGSVAKTSSPDGRDQNCNGQVDEWYGSQIELNSATGASCTSICNNYGGDCTSIGTDYGATNGKFWSWTEGSGCFDNFGNCSFIMSAIGYNCGNYAARWTQCLCVINGYR